MRLSEMVAAMKKINRHKLLGTVVRDQIARMGKTQVWAADQMGMSPSTLARIIAGDETVTDVKLRSVEGPLGLPHYLLTYIRQGDTQRIEAIGANEISPGLRRVILDALAQIEAEQVENGGESEAGG